MRATKHVYDELDRTPLRPNDFEKVRAWPSPLGALLAWPTTVVMDVAAHPCRALTCSLCLALLATSTTIFCMIFSRMLPLVCTQLTMQAVEIPDLCVFQTPLRLVLRLTSVAGASIVFTDPAFALERADGTTLIELSVLGSCVQRRLDEQCNLLSSGSVARRRAAVWGCYGNADGDLSYTACISSDGSPATCYDAPVLELPRLILERWLVNDMVARGCEQVLCVCVCVCVDGQLVDGRNGKGGRWGWRRVGRG
ncbi:hypothetical protein T492DRAFT_374897 [Pavlovales sp. CCMP2436]|nr:hypothetical protein T492DRAFT_374897 [Pavlovales sp. CCMP2436]